MPTELEARAAVPAGTPEPSRAVFLSYASQDAELEACDDRDPGIMYLLFDPFILRYKDDPRFAEFCRKVGLPVPGESNGN